MAETGWQYRDGDALGTVRYWDGSRWVGDAIAAADKPAGYELIPIEENAAAPNTEQYFTTGATSRDLGRKYASTAATDAALRHRTRKPRWDSSLTILVLVITVLKGFPLAALYVLINWYNSMSPIEAQREIGSGYVDLVDSAIPYVWAIVVIGTLLLLTQLAGALMRRPMVVFVPAVIMVIIDLLNVVSVLVGGSLPIPHIAVGLLQLWIVRWSLQLAS